jgi:polysaccharide deacetylase 2 family uncharacterized protein YibQ
MSDSRRGHGEAARIALLAAVGVGLFALGVLVGARYGASTEPGVASAPPRRGSPPAPAPEPPASAPVEPLTAPPAEDYEVPDAAGARIALVIDDLGRSVEHLDALDALGVPMTYSVLPFEARTPEVVAAIRRRGGELICHLPMEAREGADPGPGALTAQMSPEELAAATRAALAAVPGAVGVNNHMGSRLSADASAMAPILEVVEASELFYLDSRTSAASVGYRLALERGLPTAERQVFLDGELSAAAIEEQFDRLLWLARDRGEAVAIAHPHRLTLDVLARRVPEARAAGYEFVPVSYLLDRSAAPE